MRLRDEQSGNARLANPWIKRTAFVLMMMLLGYALGVYTTSHRFDPRKPTTALLGTPSIAVVHAQDAAQATTYVTMPKAWGPMVGTMTGVLVFQDRAGTIRLVAANTGAVGEVITRN